MSTWQIPTEPEEPLPPSSTHHAISSVQDASVDLILADPPYDISVGGVNWDNVANYMQFARAWLTHCSFTDRPLLLYNKPRPPCHKASTNARLQATPTGIAPSQAGAHASRPPAAIGGRWSTKVTLLASTQNPIFHAKSHTASPASCVTLKVRRAAWRTGEACPAHARWWPQSSPASTAFGHSACATHRSCIDLSLSM